MTNVSDVLKICKMLEERGADVCKNSDNSTPSDWIECIHREKRFERKLNGEDVR